MITSYSAGEKIDSWCTKCKLQLGHTIIAVVDNLPKRIQCNTCEEHHNVSTRPSGKSGTKSKSSARKTSSKETTYEEYISRLRDSDPANSKKYDTKGDFHKDEIIDHLSFGIGIVLSVIQINKIKILFKDGPRLLIQNQ